MITPMWFQIAGVAFNFILDPLLIFGAGPFPKMGIAGAALATVLGYTLSMLIALVQLFFTKQKVRPISKGYRFEPKMLGMLISYGLPSFIMNVLCSFMVNFANIFLVKYSDTAVAFFGAYFKVQQLIVMTVNGLIHNDSDLRTGDGQSDTEYDYTTSPPRHFTDTVDVGARSFPAYQRDMAGFSDH